MALLELVADVVLSLLFGAIPERQPWRALVATFYFVGALAGVGVIVWAIVAAV